MGQKVHPKGLRIGVIKDWDGKWFAKKGYAENIHQDYQIRSFLRKNLKRAGISIIEIERIADRVRITINCARPGIVIGRKGVEVAKLKDKLSKIVKGDLQIKIIEVKSPELDAQLVAGSIAEQLERKGSTKRAMRQAANRSMKIGAEGIKISCSGRIGGAEIARTEWHLEGRLPLHTLRADIDYGFAEANTTYGKIGVTVWIFRGEILPTKNKNNQDNAKQKKDKKVLVNNNDKVEGNRRGEVQKDVTTN
ncbi:MAG: 30S ribosomal protein S3 [Candidatus Caldatribacteriota bacterium]|nr:30S ribosomal protein S3 [Candidatus Caldatribacteriota bacterium]